MAELARRMTSEVAEKDKYGHSAHFALFSTALTLVFLCQGPHCTLQTRERGVESRLTFLFSQAGLKKAGFNWYSGIKGTGTVLRMFLPVLPLLEL